MQLNALFCCLWRNVEASCHKQFAVLSRHQQTPPLTTSEASQLAVRRRSIDTSPVAALTERSEARYKLRIAISAYPTCIRCPRHNIAMMFGMEKMVMVKKFRIYLYYF